MGCAPDDVLQKAHDEVISETEKAFKKRFPTGKLAKEIALIAFSDMHDYVQVDSQGQVRPLAFDELKAGKSRAVKKIRQQSKIIRGKGKEAPDVLKSVFEFELWDKEEALRLGAEYSGYKPTEKKQVKHEGNLTVEIVSYADKANGKGNGEDSSPS